MTKAQEDELRALRNQVDKLLAQSQKLFEENQEMREELRHYQTAAAGIVWLLKQGEKRDFQM